MPQRVISGLYFEKSQGHHVRRQASQRARERCFFGGGQSNSQPHIIGKYSQPHIIRKYSQPHIMRRFYLVADSFFFGGGQLFFSRNQLPRGAWIGAQGLLEGGGGGSWMGARECLGRER